MSAEPDEPAAPADRPTARPDGPTARPDEPDEPARRPDEPAGRPEDPLTLAGAQARVDEWISGFEEGYWPPLHNLARLVEEVGELAREMNHRFGSKPKRADEPDSELALELGDVLFVLLVIANERGIDLAAALERVLEKYRVRDSTRWTPKEGGGR